jgi:hypothetical protein
MAPIQGQTIHITSQRHHPREPQQSHPSTSQPRKTSRFNKCDLCNFSRGLQCVAEKCGIHISFCGGWMLWNDISDASFRTDLEQEFIRFLAFSCRSHTWDYPRETSTGISAWFSASWKSLIKGSRNPSGGTDSREVFLMVIPIIECSVFRCPGFGIKGQTTNSRRAVLSGLLTVRR